MLGRHGYLPVYAGRGRGRHPRHGGGICSRSYRTLSGCRRGKSWIDYRSSREKLIFVVNGSGPIHKRGHAESELGGIERPDRG